MTEITIKYQDVRGSRGFSRLFHQCWAMWGLDPKNLRQSSVLGLRGAALGGIQHLLPVALCSIQGDVAPEGARAALHDGSMVVGPRLLCRVPSRCVFDNGITTRI